MAEDREAREVVVPGDVLDPGVGMKPPYTMVIGGELRATVVGIVDSKGDKKRFIPLQGVYMPREDDVVIGLVESVGVLNWFVDINSPYQAVLAAQDFLGRQFNPGSDDLFRYLKPGEYIKAKVASFERLKNPVLTVKGEGLGKIVRGVVVEVSPAKIPRIVGRKGSMVSALEEKTGCSIFPAVNGRIHIECPDSRLESIAVLAVKTIEREAHTRGLTERVMKLIEEEKVFRGA